MLKCYSFDIQVKYGVQMREFAAGKMGDVQRKSVQSKSKMQYDL
jgi:hypothetical protein